MDSRADNVLNLSLAFRNKPVKVTLEFPGQANEKAEQEFTGRLKALYLKKFETGKRAEEFPFFPAGDREGNRIE